MRFLFLRDKIVFVSTCLLELLCCIPWVWVVMFPLSLFSRYFLISSLVIFMIHCLFNINHFFKKIIGVWLIYNVLVSGVQQIASVIHIHVKACMFSHVCLFLTPWTVANRLLCPWNFPCKNTGVGCHLLLQDIFLTQELNLCLLCLLHW